MKNHYKLTIVTQEKTEEYEMDHYYEVLHFMFDIIVFKFNNISMILKLEVTKRENENE